MVLNFCVTLLSRLLSSGYQTRDALQWWHQRQISRLHDGAELIRDGVLQDLFTVRRTLELARDQQEPIPQSSLQQLEALHLRLEQVSNELSPAFVRDSLPHAIQYALQKWQSRYPAVKLATHLHQAELREPTLVSRVALTTLEELLILISADLGANAAVDITLACRGDTALLTIRLDGLDSRQCQAIASRKELAYLRQSFQFWTNGNATQTFHSTGIQWQFSWSDPLCC